jgi:anti-sigma28 factor (negative regulator of flagellin synthesis)
MRAGASDVVKPRTIFHAASSAKNRQVERICPFGQICVPVRSSGQSIGMAKTAKEREEERKLEKLAAMKEQIESGSLSVRKMTPAELKRYAPRRPPKEGGKRGGSRRSGSGG